MANRKKLYNEITSEDGTIIYEPCNVSVIRKVASLKQVELAKLSGLSQAYLSEVESAKKVLTKDAAEKIAEALNRLINEPGKSDYKIDPVLIWAGHIASYQPEEFQKRIIDLFLLINQSQAELYKILKHKEHPTNPDLITVQPGESTRIVSLIKKRLDVIQENKEAMIKNEDTDETGGPLMSFMPKF